MSKKANPVSIGLFIVIGLILGVACLLVFSSSKFFTQTRECILYFNDSLNGLNAGAPVKYRGVTIGSVKRVLIYFNQSTNDYVMPVIIEIQKNLLVETMGVESEMFDRNLETSINAGLRGFLQSESLVTGVLYIEIRLLHNPPKPVYHQLEKLYPEIPTEPTQIQQLMSNLASLDIKRLENQLNSLLGKLNAVVEDVHMQDINNGITNLLLSLERVVSSPEITNSFASLQTTLQQYRLLGEKLTSRVDPLADDATNALAQASQALTEIRDGVQNLSQLVSPDSALRNDLAVALQQLSGAAQSISALTEFLERHPNALITGRQVFEKKP